MHVASMETRCQTNDGNVWRARKRQENETFRFYATVSQCNGTRLNLVDHCAVCDLHLSVRGLDECWPFGVRLTDINKCWPSDPLGICTSLSASRLLQRPFIFFLVFEASLDTDVSEATRLPRRLRCH